MNFQGRNIDPVALWENYVEFPSNMVVEGKYLPLVQCPNPEHDTHKRHFQINFVDGLVHCFAQCGISGTFIKAISLIEGCNEREARRKILDYKTHRVTYKRKNEKYAGSGNGNEIPPYSSYLPPVGIEYLSDRAIRPGSIARWQIGWDYEDLRVVIPAKDIRGVTRFLIKRATNESQNPKYLYDPEGVAKNSLLFGACHLDPRMVKSEGIVLVEGSIDAIRLHQEGFSNVVAVLGTGISADQAKILARLRPKKVICFFDKDLAGVHGIQIAQRRLSRYPLYVCRYPKGKSDPAECEGREVERILERAIPISKLLTA